MHQKPVYIEDYQEEWLKGDGEYINFSGYVRQQLDDLIESRGCSTDE